MNDVFIYPDSAFSTLNNPNYKYFKLLYFYQFISYGEEYKACSIFGVGFSKQVCPVFINGSFTDKKGFSNFMV